MPNSPSDFLPRTLAIIPARGGSKGLPGKNIKPIHGKPLIQWSIEQALASHNLTRAIVSTDSEEIAQVARNCGGDVPFLRPKEFARDSSPTSDVVLHCLDTLEESDESYDFVAILEPTSPLRHSADIDRAIKVLAQNPSCQSAVSVGEIHTEHPIIAKRIHANCVVPYIEGGQAIHQRQQADKSYFPYGVVYLARVPAFREQHTFYTPSTIPIPIKRWQNYEIDDATDFMIVERLLQHYGTQLT